MISFKFDILYHTRTTDIDKKNRNKKTTTNVLTQFFTLHFISKINDYQNY